MSTGGPGRLGRRDPARRDKAPGLLLGVAALLAVAMVVDVLLPPVQRPAAARVEQPPATAGVWYCPGVAGAGGSAVLHVAAVGDEASQIVVDRYRRGRARSDDPRTVEPGTEAVVELSGRDANAPVSVRWSGGPTAVTWRMVGEEGRAAAAPCAPRPSPHWYIPGFTTTRGSEALVHVFNPYTSDAVVRLLFAKPEGPETLVLADNILVDAGTTTTLKLRDFMPELPDLGVIVETLAGRVVAQGELNVTPPPRTSGAAGRVLLAAAPEPQEAWAFATATANDNAESWLSVLNPGQDEAAVEIRVSNPAGDASSLLGEVSVPAGGLSRIELAGASENAEFGVSLTVVNGQPVVAARLTSRPFGGKQVLSGVAGGGTPSPTWALLGSGTERNTGVVAVYNPGPEATLVDLVAPGAAANWSDIQVGPNRRVVVDLTGSSVDTTALPVVVRAEGPVVADVRSTTLTNAFGGWDSPGTPAAAWVGATSRPAVRRDPQLSTHAGIAPETADDPLGGFQDVAPATEPEG